MKSPIGGFIELDIAPKRPFYHENAYAVSNGRAATALIMDLAKPSKVYVPYYACQALYDPLIIRNIPFEYYGLTPEMKPDKLPELHEAEMFIYINFFSTRHSYAGFLERRYGSKLIVDNTQSFFTKAYKKAWAFNSARKFFGVADGAFMYSPYGKESLTFERKTDFNFLHLVNRLSGLDDRYYREYLISEEELDSNIYRISRFSELVLRQIDMQNAKKKREENFSLLHSRLKHLNRFPINEKDVSGPHYYPLFPEDKIDKALFSREKIFIPTLWPDVQTRSSEGAFKFDKEFADKLLPLPIDHRYGVEEMNFVIQKVLEYAK